MNNKKIYIIGPVGSGKTTFATKLANKYNIKYYELDKVAWDDDNGHIRRTDEEALKILDDILNNDSWVIEDVGRNKFKKGREEADIIYYIKLPKIKSFYRVSKRWIKQRLGLERYNHPPTFNEWLYYLSTVRSYYKKEPDKVKSLEEHKDKLVYVNKKKIKKILR